MVKLDFLFNRIVPITIYSAIILVVVSFGASLLQFNIETQEENSRQSSFTDADPYATATRHVNDGALGKALSTYSKIINNDDMGTEEDAWHEKGKILNRLGYCNDAVNHYTNYLITFPDSKRAIEGYDLAKQC